MSNYARQPVTFVKGEGAWLYDDKGKTYLDALSGIAVCGLGHSHPAITTAICDQAKQLIHTSNLYGILHQSSLAQKLAEITGMETAFFCNSGAEANEAAIKIARLYGHQRGYKKPTIIVTEDSFHGRTLATLTATGNPKVKIGFDPLPEGFIHVPYNDIASIEKLAQENKDIVAILVEPIIGEGGILIPDDDYLAKIREICNRHHCLMLLDEIQTGMGRTGKWCAYQYTDIKPDVLTLAKGLGNGMPIGSCLARGEAAQILQPGTHGSTFGGNPLVCKTALAVIETIEHLLPRIQKLGQYFYQQFISNLANIEGVESIRVKGLMIGIELNKPCGQLVSQALEKQLLINVTAERVVRLLPPFIITDEQANSIITTVSNLIQTFLEETTE